MKPAKKVIATLFTLCLLFSESVLAQIAPMNYQGRLLDDNGVPVTGSYNFVIRLWDVPTGGSIPEFEEQHSNTNVSDGVYSFLIGNGTPTQGTWDLGLWSGPMLYLEVEVNGETLSPRHLIAASPISFQASNSQMLDDKPADDYAEDSEVNNLLSDICSTQKGVWLPELKKCAGGSVDLSFEDLSNYNISGAHFDGADLSYTQNTNTNYSDSVWFDVHLTGAPGITFNNTNFTNAEMRMLDMAGVYLDNIIATNLYGHDLASCPSSLPTDWSCLANDDESFFLVGPDSRLVNVKLKSGHNWPEATYSQLIAPDSNFMYNTFNGTSLPGSDFYFSNFNRSVFNNVGLTDIDFTGSAFRFVIMNGADLALSDFSNADFHNLYAINITTCPDFLPTDWMCVTQGSGFALIGPSARFYHPSIGGYSWQADCLDFSNADLSNANFKNNIFNADNGACTSINYNEYEFDMADLSGAVFDGATTDTGDASKLHFYNCDLSNASFVGVDFEKVNFQGCNLTGADFTGANLIGFLQSPLALEGDFTNANFTNANLVFRNMTTATLTGAIWSNTICPDGTNSNDNGNTCIGHLAGF